MKPWLALLSAVVALAGCQQSAQPTNPFLQTTVPPPGTASGDFPGAPQIVPGTAAPAVTPGPAPMLAPPPKDRFSPPGGSFQYNQSSIDRTKAIQPTGSEYRIGQSGLARRTPANASGAASVAGTQIAGNSASTQVTTTSALSDQGTTLSFASAEPKLQSLAATSAPGQPTPAGQSSLRILGPATAGTALSSAQMRALSADPNATPRMSLTLAGNAPEITDLAEHGFKQVQQASYTPTGLSAGYTGVTQVGFNQTSPTSASSPSGTRYSYSPDYSTLHGRLEYSQSLKQWKLRYIPIDGKTDQFGGSVVLSGSSNFERFKPNDFVAVRGRMSSESAAARGFAPKYDVASIDAVAK